MLNRRSPAHAFFQLLHQDLEGSLTLLPPAMNSGLQSQTIGMSNPSRPEAVIAIQEPQRPKRSGGSRAEAVEIEDGSQKHVRQNE